MSVHDSALIAALKDIVAAHDTSATATPVKSSSVVPDPTLTIAEFCEAESISAATFWKLSRMGLGPEVRRLPGFTLKRITFKARQEWHAKLDALSHEQAETIEVERLRELASRRRAGKLSAASRLKKSRRS